MPPLVAAAAVTAVGSIYAANKQSSASRHAADQTTNAANHAADLEAAAAQQALDFQRQQAQLQQNNYMNTQAFNRQVYTDQQARLQPYRNLGLGSIAQLSRPIGGGQ